MNRLCSFRSLCSLVILVSASLPVRSQEPSQEQVDQSHVQKQDAIKRSARWSVMGRVIDINGNPIRGAIVRANTGIGTLTGGGQGQSDDDGNYQFAFGPGIHFANDDVQMQIATISAAKPGYFVKNLSQHGELRMALKIPENFDGERLGATKEEVILPGKPHQLDFVMLPAAQVTGVVVDEQERPLTGYGVSLNGEQMPPSSSVAASAKTDEQGKFRLTEIPTGYEFQFLVKPRERHPPWNAWASGKFQFLVDADNAVAISDGKQTLRATRFRIRVKTSGVNWKRALKIGADHQTIAHTDDGLELMLAPPGHDQSKPVIPKTVQGTIGQLTPTGTRNENGQFKELHSGAVSLQERHASLEIPKSVDLSFAKLNSIGTKLHGPLRIDTRFVFRGPRNAERRIVVDVRVINDRRQTTYHDWRIIAERFDQQGESSEPGVRQPTRARVELPRLALHNIRSLRIGLRELTESEIATMPDRRSRTNLKVSIPNERGEFAIWFDNPENRHDGEPIGLDPTTHQVIVQLLIRDEQGKLVDKRLQQLPARKSGGYEVQHKIDPRLFPFSTVSTTFVTIQPDHDRWVDDFFREGKGTSYSGIWTSDTGELNKLPVNGAAKN